MAIPPHTTLGGDSYRTNQLGFTGMTPGGGKPRLVWQKEYRVWNDDWLNIPPGTVYIPTNTGPIYIVGDKVIWTDKIHAKRHWLRCHNLITGALIWETDLRTKIDEGLVAKADKNIYTAVDGLQNQVPTPPGRYGSDNEISYATICAVTDTMIYMKSFGTINQVVNDSIGAYPPHVWAFDITDGSELWTSQDLTPLTLIQAYVREVYGSSTMNSPLIVDNGDIIFATNTGHFRLKATDGSVMWSWPAELSVTGRYSSCSPWNSPTLLRSGTEYVNISMQRIATNHFLGEILSVYSAVTGVWQRDMEANWEDTNLFPVEYVAAAPMAHSNGELLSPASNTVSTKSSPYPGWNPLRNEPRTTLYTTETVGNISWHSKRLAWHNINGWAEGKDGHIYGLSRPASKATPGDHHTPIAIDIADGTEKYRASKTLWPIDFTLQVTDIAGVIPPQVNAHYAMTNWVKIDDDGTVFMIAKACNWQKLHEDIYWTGGVWTVEGKVKQPWGRQRPKLFCYADDLTLGWELELESGHVDTGILIDRDRLIIQHNSHPETCFNMAFGRGSDNNNYFVHSNNNVLACYKQGGTAIVNRRRNRHDFEPTRP